MASPVTAVADASFLIGVSVIGQWKTLEALTETLYVANEVWAEVVVRGVGKPGAKELSQAAFVERRTVSNAQAVAMLTPTLDEGEAETVVLATELGVTTVFLDDRRGRKVAQSAGLQVIGIAGFLLFAKRSAKIEAVQPLLLQLHQKGFRLSSKLIDAVSRQAGEIPTLPSD
jgi:predicted nucleic acid-binding protein